MRSSAGRDDSDQQTERWTRDRQSCCGGKLQYRVVPGQNGNCIEEVAICTTLSKKAQSSFAAISVDHGGNCRCVVARFASPPL